MGPVAGERPARRALHLQVPTAWSGQWSASPWSGGAGGLRSVALQMRNGNSRVSGIPQSIRHMPAPAPQRPDRYATAISLPRHLAEHVAAKATALGLSSAAYIRILIAQDMGITLDGTPANQA